VNGSRRGAWLSGALLAALLAPQAGAAGAAGPAYDSWTHYGGDQAGIRYSALAGINRDNVKNLAVAWRYSTGELQRRGPELIANSSTQTTAIIAAGSLVFCTPFNRIIALDPATGRERWVFDPKVPLDHPLPFQYNCRGVTPWDDPDAPAGAACAQRIIMGANDGRIYAVDARTGRACEGFGEGGSVQVTWDRPSRWKGEAKIASAPVVVNGVIATGAFIMDNLRTDAPTGSVYAFDARTGAPKWRFDTIPGDPADPGYATWLEGSAERTGAANVWSTMVADPERNLIFAPVGSASPDFWGGERKGDNLYSSSLVALDATTGERRWHFQLVRHDIWDYDAASPPMLVDIRRNGKVIPAVVQNTKQGFSFVLERDTGKPVFGVVDKPAPQRALSGEWLSPTQPWPVKPEPLVPTKVTPDDAWGFTPWDRWQCRKLIEGLRSEGIFTPPSTGAGTILSPGNAGGMNWGGPAYDPTRQLMVVNTNRVPQVVQMIPRAEIPGVTGITLEGGRDVAAQEGTPYGVHRFWLLSPWGAPCVKPPWGELVAVDLASGDVRWRVPLGSIERQLPLKFEWNLGTPNLGGPVVTAGGLVFIAATMDNVIRAFDVESGKMLWRDDLPAGGQATPMTYAADGRQFVVMISGHHMWFGSPAGDEVIAYALPK